MAWIISENAEARVAVCMGCEWLIKQRKCGKCGCNIFLKSRFKAAHCPLGKWEAVDHPVVLEQQEEKQNASPE